MVSRQHLLTSWSVIGRTEFCLLFCYNIPQSTEAHQIFKCCSNDYTLGLGTRPVHPVISPYHCQCCRIWKHSLPHSSHLTDSVQVAFDDGVEHITPIASVRKRVSYIICTW